MTSIPSVKISVIADKFIKNISNKKISIYDQVDINDLDLWIPSIVLEEILNAHLNGLSLAGLPLRTRSKVLKSHVCEALGYPIPSSFIKTQPRFPGQQFDTYIQKSHNLQIWNEEVSPTRRYVIIKVNEQDVIENVRVISGQELSLLDKTGTLTKKYQAKLGNIGSVCELISPTDTDALVTLNIGLNKEINNSFSPTDPPEIKSLLPIATVFEKLKILVGRRFKNPSHDQERNRGADLHKMICNELGYPTYSDTGRFPDITNQLLEVKLQTSPTIDLGLVSPDSKENLDLITQEEIHLRHCDVRYAIFYGHVTDGEVVLINFYLSTGERFFTRFPKFQGKIINSKIQIPLPATFFNSV